MKKVLSLFLVFSLSLGMVGCSSSSDDSKETSQDDTKTNETVDRVGLTKARVMLEVENAEGVQEVGVKLEEKSQEKTQDTNLIIYNAKKSNCELQIEIKDDGTLTGAQVTGDISGENGNEFIALVSGVVWISDFKVDSETYSKIGDVLKNQKDREEIGNLTLGVITSGTVAKFYISLNDK